MLLRSHASIHNYIGSSQDICKQIIDKCWNGTYFQTSAGHFSAFYCRDFGMCAQSLINLGYEDQVKQTLTWALDIFSRHDKITTTITNDGEPIDVFSYGVDSLPFLLHALQIINDRALIEKYKPFLEKQTIFYFHTVFDKSKNLVKESGEFSSIKDNYVRKSSCYDNCMVGWLLSTLKKLKYDAPFQSRQSSQSRKINSTPLTAAYMRAQIKKNFWQGTFFKDDLYSDIASGDAQVFPFYTGLFNPTKDKHMWILAKAAIEQQSLDVPFPLKYTATHDKGKELFLPSILAPNYEGTAIWLHLGLCYLTVLTHVDKKVAEKYLSRYARHIQEHQNFLEVFDEHANPYRTLFYQSDESMLWAAIYLDLVKNN